MNVAGHLGRSEGDFSFASYVVARFIVGRRHGTQPRATLPVEPTRPHITKFYNMESSCHIRNPIQTPRHITSAHSNSWKIPYIRIVSDP